MKHITKKHADKMHDAWRGENHSEETKKALSRQKKGKRNHSYGKVKEKSYHWKGGRIKFGTNGRYVYVFCPDHPYAIKLGYVAEHRLVMEKHIGRVLLPTEQIHHINGDTKDNRVENLMLFSSNSEHIKYEWKIKKGLL